MEQFEFQENETVNEIAETVAGGKLKSIITAVTLTAMAVGTITHFVEKRKANKALRVQREEMETSANEMLKETELDVQAQYKDLVEKQQADIEEQKNKIEKLEIIKQKEFNRGLEEGDTAGFDRGYAKGFEEGQKVGKKNERKAKA